MSSRCFSKCFRFLGRPKAKVEPSTNSSENNEDVVVQRKPADTAPGTAKIIQRGESDPATFRNPHEFTVRTSVTSRSLKQESRKSTIGSELTPIHPTTDATALKFVKTDQKGH